MKLTVKTLKGTHFEIRVQHNDTTGIPVLPQLPRDEEAQGPYHPRLLPVGILPGTPIRQGLSYSRCAVRNAHGREHLGPHFPRQNTLSEQIMAVKKNIEEIQGKDSYPWGQQLLIHNGKVLKDESTLDENQVSEDGFLVVMLSKSKASASSGASSAQPSSTPVTSQAPPVAQPQAPQPQVPSTTTSQPERPPTETPSSTVDLAASDLLSGSNLDTMINQIMEMGGGSWDRDKVQRALRAAYNNPERAIDYLYSGIPVTAEVAVPVVGQGANTTDAAPGETGLSGIPNTAPLDLFPQGASHAGGAAGGGSLDFLRNNQQVLIFMFFSSTSGNGPYKSTNFTGFLSMSCFCYAHLHSLSELFAGISLQPMLQELSKQNPQLLRLIQENNDEFLQLLNETFEGGDGDFLDQADQDEMPHAISVTPEEQEAIGRLEAMGFERERVIEAFFACDRNEQLAANYLLEHAGDEE
uniref:Ubiquitin receptor RAD23 n=1 Tax=Aegilops tauschii TaxID=37682 RepID=R7W5B8_AEGTA